MERKVQASKVVSDKWFVRVDGEESFLRQKCETMANYTNVLLFHALYHTGSLTKENPHAHYIVSLNKPIQKQSYDIKVKELFNVTGTSYSTKPWDGQFEGAGSYLYHELLEKNQIIPELASKGVSDDNVREMMDFAIKWNEIKVEKKAKASMTLTKKALEHFGTSEYATLKEIWEFLHHCVRTEGVYHPGENLMRKYTIEVFSKVSRPTAWTYYVNSAFDRAFPPDKF